MKNYYKEFMKDNNLKEESKILIKSGEHKGEKVSVSNCCMIILGATNSSKFDELEELKLENLIMRGKVEFEKVTNYEEIRFAEALDRMKNEEKTFIEFANEKKFEIELSLEYAGRINFDTEILNIIQRTEMMDKYLKITDALNHQFYKECENE